MKLLWSFIAVTLLATPCVAQPPSPFFALADTSGSVWIVDDEEGALGTPGRRNPTTAVLLSLFVGPGTGQFYNHEPLNGFIQFSAAFTCWLLYFMEDGVDDPNDMKGLYLTGAVVISAWSLIDADAGAKRCNKRNGLSDDPPQPPPSPSLSLNLGQITYADNSTPSVTPGLGLSLRF